MSRKEDIIQKIESEVNDYYSDDSLYNISSWGADLSFRELITQYEEGSLLKPEMQRNYVWDKTEASRFVDSILLGLPVPSIFLAKTQDEKMLIVDGYQRIMTIFDFVRGIFSRENKVFKLTRSEKINPRWRGKAFSELNDLEQRKIKATTIHCISEGDTRQKALQIIILNGNTSSLPSFSRASGLPIPLQGSLWISFIISACSILIK